MYTYFIDSSKIIFSNYSYKSFDEINKTFGIDKEKNENLHQYFNWVSPFWKFNYELLDRSELCNFFKKSLPYKENTSFFIRLDHNRPLIKVSYKNLSSMLEDLIYEVGNKGREAVSDDGKYFFEFTDDYCHQAISNFEILPATIVL